MKMYIRTIIHVQYIHVHVHVYTMYIYMCKYAYMYSTCVYIHEQYTCTQTYMYNSIYMYMYIYMYIHVQVHVHAKTQFLVESTKLYIHVLVYLHYQLTRSYLWTMASLSSWVVLLAMLLWKQRIGNVHVHIHDVVCVCVCAFMYSTYNSHILNVKINLTVMIHMRKVIFPCMEVSFNITWHDNLVDQQLLKYFTN